MSIQANYAGGLQRPGPVPLTTTDMTAIVVASNRSNTVAGYSLANGSGSTVQVACYYYDGTTEFLVWIGEIPAYRTEIISDAPLQLFDGDEFRVQAAAGAAITVNPTVVFSHQNEAR
ncbi:MAG: hypothetical protein COA78_17255 [Blastopirellula sp.]|nr:MAG: hypothetical protein COA78_17255 [Blastopirellula sp.]